MLKIVSAKVIVTCPGRNFVTLKIETADGVTGLGDATLNGRELAVASYLNDHIVPCLIGRDAHHDRRHLAISLSRRLLAAWAGHHGGHRRGGHGAVGHQGQGRGPAALSTCWAANAATARMVYCHANGNTIEETLEKAQAYIDQGYKAVRLQSGVPGLASTYGVSKDTDSPTSRPMPTSVRACLVQREISALRCPNCSRQRATCWAGMCICCTTCITA